MHNDVRFWFDRIPTPVGELVIVASESGSLRAVNWPKSAQASQDDPLPLRDQREQIILEQIILEPKHDSAWL